MCNFSISIPITSSVEDINSMASASITSNGGTFTRTIDGGAFAIDTFLGSIEGSYNVASGSVAVTITSKPWIVSCSRIESELNKYINGEIT